MEEIIFSIFVGLIFASAVALFFWAVIAIFLCRMVKVEFDLNPPKNIKWRNIGYWHVLNCNTDFGSFVGRWFLVNWLGIFCGLVLFEIFIK